MGDRGLLEIPMGSSYATVSCEMTGQFILSKHQGQEINQVIYRDVGLRVTTMRQIQIYKENNIIQVTWS